jgi:nicotinamide riboside kinase
MAPAGGAPRRIGLIGGECSGKTSLAAALATALPACGVAEVLREFVDREGRAPLRGEQSRILAEQQAREDAAARRCPQGWLVADPAPLMTAVYSRLYFADDSLTAPAAEHALGYQFVVWCAADLPWTPDGLHRDGREARDRANAIIADLVRDELEPRGIPVIRAHGSVEERVDLVRRAWQP